MAEVPLPQQAQHGRMLGSRYRLDRLIANGGMAQVWSAVDEVLARPVAVKLLHPHLAEDVSFVERFRREAVAAARLAHPGIVSIFDTCSEDGTEAIVMELVRGTTLRQEIERRDDKVLDPAEAVALCAQVADALECAHRAGIVHRDVKPANILLSQDGRVLVTDFGIAKALVEGSDLTNSGSTIGTVRYLAPEQVEGGPIDGRTDVYALGVTLYELLTGRPPFDAGSDAATAFARLHRDPLRPRQIRAGVPRAVEEVTMRALARDPAARYQSAAELRAALVSAGRDAHLERAFDPDATVAIRRDDEAGGTPLRRPDTGATGVIGPTGAWTVGGAVPRAEPVTPTGTPVVAAPRRQRRRAPALLAVLVLAAVVAGVVAFSRTSTWDDLFGDDVPGASAGGDALAVTSATAYDPQGDGSEHDDEAALAIDGDASTGWTTQQYNSRNLGGLKDGVGLIVSLDQPADIRALVVSTPTTGWAARVYVADAIADELDGWGDPVTEQSGLGGNVTFDLGEAHGQHILLWITDIGDGGNRAQVNEIVPEA